MEMSTSSSAEVLASPSQSQETEKVLAAQAVLCGNTSDVFEKLSQLGSCGKTSRVRFRHRRGKISDACSSPWLNSGMVCLGEFLTLNISEYPKHAEECMLSDILETTVPSRYFLTAKACQGILRRCAKVGRPLPSQMKKALEKQAHTPCKSAKVAEGGKGALIKTDISPTICASARPTIFCRANHHSKAACYEELAPTLTAHAKAEAPLISLTPPRHLTPRECERLQGFPDDWTAVLMPNGKPVSNTQRYKMLGNSMAVPVMRWIGARILLVERSNNAN